MQTIETPEAVAFGPFVLDLATRTLLARGEKCALSSRAFDILSLLVTEHARVVTKDEIIATVWRGLAVEENNLAVQISALRRVLADHARGQTLILTVPGQGYRFVGKIEEPSQRIAPPEMQPRELPQPPMPPAPAPRLAPPLAAPPRRRWSRLAPALGLVALCAAGGLLWQWTRAPEPPRLSIAVLPFRNLSDDRSQDYLADAISDDLTTDLAHLPGSVVIARESSDVYKGHAAPAEQIGRALNVRYLLEGSLRAVENTFSVNAQLIDASNGTHLWATQFTVPRDKLRDAQTIIVGKIGSALNVRLVEIESDRSLRARPKNPDVADLYLQARSRHNSATGIQDLIAAQTLLSHALDKAPGYTPAIVELTSVLLDKITYYDDTDEPADFTAAGRLSETALATAPRDDTVLTAAGRYKMLNDQLSDAEQSFRAAIEINPNNVLARVGLVGCEFRQGQFVVSRDELQTVMRLDPQGAKAQSYHYYYGVSAFMTGLWPESIGWFRRSLAEGGVRDESLGIPEWSTLFLIAALDKTGDAAQARKLFADYQSHWPNRSIWRLSSYFWKPQVDNPGFQVFRDGLRHMGMPLFATEMKTARVDGNHRGDFDPAPDTLPGSTAIDLPGLRTLLHQSSTAVLVDVGTGSAMLPGTLHSPEIGAQGVALPPALTNRRAGAPVIVIGEGWLGWTQVDAVRRLTGESIEPVYWLRGGEEALAASGEPGVFNGRVP